METYLPAVLADLSASNLQITTRPDDHHPHFTHVSTRAWPETNCYFDLWIELLHSLCLDPVPAFACMLSTDWDGLQWSFVKPPPEDLRRLYGLEVNEENVWLPVLETVESGPARGVLHTVEVDGWWLPDTLGTSYHNQHVKTTIVPTRVNRQQRVMTYLHNAGLFELKDDDFDGVFGLQRQDPLILTPYVEQIRYFPERAEPDAVLTIVREHLSRRADSNPVTRMLFGVQHAREWLPRAGMDVFHAWAFATLRQCGATAELAGDLAMALDDVVAGTAVAAEHFRSVAAGAKSVQFKMARAAGGRSVDASAAMSAMADSWELGMETLAAVVN